MAIDSVELGKHPELFFSSEKHVGLAVLKAQSPREPGIVAQRSRGPTPARYSLAPSRSAVAAGAAAGPDIAA
jgi:hypothetical protein